MGACVILLHRTPDGSEHYDLLLQRPAGGRLVTFRLQTSPAGPPPWRLPAERLPDHREEYLEFEGDIPGRGCVRRIARGRCEVEIDHPREFRATVQVRGATGVLVGRDEDNGLWNLDLRPCVLPGQIPAAG